MTKYICKACGHDYSGAMPHPGTISPPTVEARKKEFMLYVAQAVGKEYRCPVKRVPSAILAVEDRPPPEPSFLPKPKVADGKWRFE